MTSGSRNFERTPGFELPFDIGHVGERRNRAVLGFIALAGKRLSPAQMRTHFQQVGRAVNFRFRHQRRFARTGRR